MATVTKENIGLLNEKLTLKLEKTDYLPTFEKSLKDYSKKANIPGFRKGMVPAGLIKKMYGTDLLKEEVLRTIDKEVFQFLCFGQSFVQHVERLRVISHIPAGLTQEGETP